MLFSSGLDYSLQEVDGFNVLGMSGALTIIAFDAIVTVVHNLTEKESLIIDMENIVFLTSSGINALIEISHYAKEHGTRVILMSLGDDIINLIDYIDSYRHFIFAGSFEEAKTKIEYYV